MTQITERLTTLLDQQLLASLSDPEQQELTDLLATEEGSQFHREYLALQEGIVAVGRASMKTTIQSWESSIEAPKKSGIIRRMPIWGGLLAVAAAATLLVLIFWPRENEQLELLAELSQPYPNLLMPVARSSAVEGLLAEGFAAYESGAYAEAIRLWAEADTASLDLDFYRANALQASGNSAAALELFAAVADSNARFAEQAEWYQAMLLWQAGQQTEAETIIERIASDQDHEMWKRAQRWEE